jgi:hypothetical protein
MRRQPQSLKSAPLSVPIALDLLRSRYVYQLPAQGDDRPLLKKADTYEISSQLAAFGQKQTSIAPLIN